MLTMQEADLLFGKILDGQMSAEEISTLLVELAERGETAAEIAGAARAMRARMIHVEAPENAIDVCGTGGDGQHSLNVSTAVALVVAACDVPVAKHGNRAASSKAGGADTLEALGLDLARASETAEETLADLGIAFLFAQKRHPALGRIAPIRKSLGRRTIFNLLGPLANPAGVTRQLVGVASPALIPLYAEAMTLLGTESAMIVSGAEGLDELSISGESHFASIPNPFVSSLVETQASQTPNLGISTSLDENGDWAASGVITPKLAGLPRHPPEALKGGDATYNAAALRRLLEGDTGAYRDAVLLNAAGALIVAGEVSDWKAGIEEAAEAIDKGLAKALLDCWVRF